MFVQLLRRRLIVSRRLPSIDVICCQMRCINKNYDKVIKLFPPEVEYNAKDSRFFEGQQPEDEPYLRLTDDEICELSSVKLEKDYTERRLTKVDITQEPYNEVLVGFKDEKFTQTQSITDKSLWFWVQRLLPKNVLPDELSTDESHERHERHENRANASGFSLPSKVRPDLCYFIPRTRSKLFPVYRKYKVENRNHSEYWKNRWDGLYNSYHKDLLERLDEIRFKNNETTLTLTLITQIQGNIWQMEEDLRGELELIHKRRILSAVNEPNGILTLKGDFVMDSIKWLNKMGF